MEYDVIIIGSGAGGSAAAYRLTQAGKKVLVLGIGNSACDIAVESSRVASRTFLAMRRGAHIMPKYLFGMPTDHLTTSPLARFAPAWLQALSVRSMLRLAAAPLSRRLMSLNRLASRSETE